MSQLYHDLAKSQFALAEVLGRGGRGENEGG